MKIILLKGGLGNQLFQFCLYLELINKNHPEKVFIDNKTGFLLDFKYKRNFELDKAISRKILNSKFNSTLNIILLFLKKCGINKIFEMFKIKIIDDKEFNLNKKSTFINNQQYLLFDGYFQNFKIVDKNFSELVKHLEPYLFKKVNNKFDNLYKKILSTKNSVALCIRFYEESKEPGIHSLNGRNIKLSQFNKVIKEIEKELINPHFFIFVQHTNNFTEKLNINSKFTIVSHDNGFTGSWERLRAQSYCKHHIFNNSTFYFWGAIFSQYWEKNKKTKQVIYTSNNFVNQEIYNPEWRIF